MAEAAKRLHTFEEYLAQEEASLEKHEFYQGHILAMAGGTIRHAWLASQVTFALVSQLGRGPCRVFSSDLRVRVLETGLSTYPDLSVVCGAIEGDPLDRHAILNPSVLVEVLSPGSERYDRGEKFDHYQKIPSLQDYVLVSTETRKIEVFHRSADGSWRYTRAGPGERARLDSLGLALDVDELYRDAPEVEPAP